MSPHAAEGLALRYVDRDVRTGDRFIYRVLPAVQDETWWIDTAYDVVEVAESTPIPPPIGLELEERDGAVRLTWRNPEGYSFSGFVVDRSEDNGRTFTELHATPIVPITSRDVNGEQFPDYIDTTIRNYRRYVWRVRGVTHFGEMSQPEIVEGMGRDLTPPGRPVMERPLLPAGNRVVLEWEVEGETSDLDGFVVARSRYPDEGFEQITPTPIGRGERKFVDEEGSPAHPYYMVGAVDTAGNVAPSLPVYVDLIDMTPPSTPTGLTGEIDSSGIVTLRWNLGPEEDLLGYRVLWANDSTHEFSQLTGEVLHDSIFVDTVDITTLTPVVYYRIAAVDTRYLHSSMTPPLQLLRPDIVRPEPSVFTDVFVTDSSVVLRWAASRSSDVVRQVILRRLTEGGGWEKVEELGPEISSWTDRDVRVRTRYTYRILTVDDAGLESDPAHDVNARPYDSGVRPGVDRLSGRYDERKGRVRLTWEFGDLKEKEWFVIYRSYNGSRMKQYRAVEGDEREFIDALLVGSGTYTYGVRVMTPTGESPMSEEIRVVVP